MKRLARFGLLCFLTPLAAAAASSDAGRPGRDPAQPIDEEYTKKIREYTTETFFLSPLVDYLPAALRTSRRRRPCSGTWPAPRASSPTRPRSTATCGCSTRPRPRVRVRSIGTTEEGREMIAVTIASEALLAKLDENRGAAREARRPAHDRHGRRRGGEAGRRRRSPSTTSPARSTPPRPARPRR